MGKSYPKVVRQKMGKQPMIGLDLSATMLAIKLTELRVIKSGRTFLNFFLDRPTPPALDFFVRRFSTPSFITLRDNARGAPPAIFFAKRISIPVVDARYYQWFQRREQLVPTLFSWDTAQP